MSQQEDESLEEYLERFLYNLQKSKQHSSNPDTIRTIFLKGIVENIQTYVCQWLQYDHAIF